MTKHFQNEFCSATHTIQKDVAPITYPVSFDHIRRICPFQDVTIQDESIVLEQKDSQIMTIVVERRSCFCQINTMSELAMFDTAKESFEQHNFIIG